MSRIVRWGPFREMMSYQDAMDRWMDRPFYSPRSTWFDEVDWGFPLDVVEKDEEYILKASIPGVEPDDIEITYDSNVLTIKGVVKEEKEVNEENYHMRERRYGSFSRSVSIPSIDADKIEATYSAGVLKLQLPKVEEMKPRKIKVTSGSKMIEGKMKELK